MDRFMLMQSQSEGMKSNEQSKVNLKKSHLNDWTRKRCPMLTRLNSHNLATDRQAQFFLPRLNSPKLALARSISRQVKVPE